MPYGPPQSAFTTQTPGATLTEAAALSVGSDLVLAVAGQVTALKFYRQAPNPSSRAWKVWPLGGGTPLATGTTSGESGTGWTTVPLSVPISVTAGQTIRPAVNIAAGQLVGYTDFGGDVVTGDVTCKRHSLYTNGSGVYPATSYGANLFVDIVFEPFIVPTLAITATHDPAHARIRLQVTGAADGPATIQRLDANGTAYVRLFEGQVPLAGDLLVDDYEAALSGDITYLVTDSAANTATVHLTIATTPATDGPWLTHPNLPALNTSIKIVSDDPRWQHRSTEHNVYGRAAPLFTTQPMKSRSGTLVLLADSWDEVRVIHAVYERGDPVLLRNPCLTDADYYHIGDVSTTPLAQSHWFGPWYVTVEYQSVDAPAGATAGGPWTWDDVVAGYDTWLDVITAVPTWADLTLGPVP